MAIRFDSVLAFMNYKEVKTFLIVTAVASALVWFSYIEYQEQNLDRAINRAEATSEALSVIARERLEEELERREWENFTGADSDKL